jgi:hypothetical protein
MAEPKVEYGWGRLNGKLIRICTTTYPPPTPAERAAMFAAGQRTFGGVYVKIQFLDEPGAESEADTPIIRL